MKEADVLVIGSGIAGLSFALKVAYRFPHRKVIILTKANEEESNTKYAQGGIAVVMDELKDSFEQHIQDTLRAGDGLCNRKIVEMVVKEAPERLREMIAWGARFDKNKKNQLHLGREGGHSQNRIVHHKDITGYEMEITLLKQIKKLPNVLIYNYFFVLELITQHHLKKSSSSLPKDITVYGAYVLNLKTEKIETIRAPYIMLATGGSGQVYATTTNPLIATGDGVAMACRAGAKIRMMEFIQFHPTALYEPNTSPAFLISEAVRGAGAHIINKNGQRFVFEYDPRGELASRDIVAKAIDHEMKKSGEEYVFLDCRPISRKHFIKHFPTIYEKCKSKGLDPAKDLIPIVPAAHYQCGGIVTNSHAQTSIQRLYAAGECAYTGLHGANRLASNSLLEALVFSHHAFLDIEQKIENSLFLPPLPEWDSSGTTEPKEKVLITFSRKELQLLMNNYVGIVRSNARLKRALMRIKLLKKETEQLYKKTVISPQLCELRNMIQVAELIVKMSLKRQLNKGCFYKITEEE